MMMVATGDADAFITGVYSRYSEVTKLAEQIIGIRPSYNHFGAMNIVTCKKGTFFIADTLINRHPSTEVLIDVARLTNDAVKFFATDPVIAMLSYSNFGADQQGSPQKVHGVDIPVLIKNPVNPDLELWIGAIERLYAAGIHRLGAIHRGFSTYDKKIYRNLPLWHIPIELRRRLPNLPLFCDPSHIGGKRELIAPLSQQAMDLSFDGLIIESHCNPDCALSDASQQITPDVLDYILNLLIVRDSNQTTENLTELRRQIDDIDEQMLELLAKRMRISREIGVYKKEHNMPILQSPRYSQILENRSSMGAQMDLSTDFVKEMLKEIHEESIRQQMIVMNEE